MEGCVKGSDWGIWVADAAEEEAHVFHHELRVEIMLMRWKMAPHGIQGS
jgi:hypothetical protein